MKKNLVFALQQVAPVIFPYLFIGIAFGVLMDEAGYSVGWSFLSGVFIYAGSMQIVMVSLLTAGASLGTIAMMTFLSMPVTFFMALPLLTGFEKWAGNIPTWWSH
jgi:predicted branched-subunit amino acid permease